MASFRRSIFSTGLVIGATIAVLVAAGALIAAAGLVLPYVARDV